MQDRPRPVNSQYAVSMLIGMKKIQAVRACLMLELRKMVDLEIRISYRVMHPHCASIHYSMIENTYKDDMTKISDFFFSPKRLF